VQARRAGHSVCSATVCDCTAPHRTIRCPSHFARRALKTSVQLSPPCGLVTNVPNFNYGTSRAPPVQHVFMNCRGHQTLFNFHGSCNPRCSCGHGPGGKPKTIWFCSRWMKVRGTCRSGGCNVYGVRLRPPQVRCLLVHRDPSYASRPLKRKAQGLTARRWAPPRGPPPPHLLG
jgi:hypothetical protein